MSLKKDITTESDWQLIQIIGHVFFGLYFILSLYFWKERQAYDTSHYLLELITRKWFFIAHQRPIGVVSQILPLIGIWFKLPLAIIIKLYSFGDILYYYLLFLFTSNVLKNNPASVLIILTVSITVMYTFYCPVTELLQGLALLAVWWALLYTPFRLRISVLVFLLSIIIFSHPLLFIPAGFTLVYWWSFNKERKSLASIMLVALVTISALKLLLLDKYDYQKTYYPVVFNDYSNVNNLKDIDYIFQFFELLISSYPILFSLGIITISLLLWKREFTKAILVITAIILFTFIIIGTHRFVTISNYSERMLLPLSFIICLPFCRQLFKIRNELFKNSLIVSIGIILLIRVNTIWATATPYSLRIQQMDQLIHQARLQGKQKVIANEDLLEQVSFANTGWCYSIESMILSAIDGKDSVVSIAMQHEHIDRIAKINRILLASEWIKWTEEIHSVKELPSNYFRFKKSNYISLNTNCKNEIAVLQQLKIKLDTLSTYTFNECSFIKLTFENPTIRFCSSDSTLLININILDKSNTTIFKKEIKLETDFTNTFSQFVQVENITKNENYNIEISLLQENKVVNKIKSRISLNN